VFFVFMYGSVCFGFGFYITHRIVGPMVPIMRFIRELREGRYQSRLIIRGKDDLQDLADELNQLADNLHARSLRTQYPIDEDDLDEDDSEPLKRVS